jgi:hypothetical protein
MYLALGLIVLAILFVIAGVFSGGVFTVVLVPLAVIAAVTAVVTLMSARAAGISQTLTKPPEPQTPGRMARGEGPPAGEVPATPDDYVEARQRNQ